MSTVEEPADDAGEGLDLLSQAINVVRPQLHQGVPIAARARVFWAGVAAAADLAATDQIISNFVELARETGLAADLGRHADPDLNHLIRWGLQGRDPFGSTP
jgi:hypothetical protein